MDAVGAADAEGLGELLRPDDEGIAVGAGAANDDLSRIDELEGQGSVQHVGRGEVEPLEAAEIEHLVLHDRTADEAAPALLIEGRRRGEEDRLPARVVAAGKRRLVELVVAEKPIAAPAERVRAASRDDVQHPACGLPVLGAERVGQHLEFLDPVLRKIVRLPPVELHLIRRAVHDDAVCEWPLA